MPESLSTCRNVMIRMAVSTCGNVRSYMRMCMGYNRCLCACVRLSLSSFVHRVAVVVVVVAVDIVDATKSR